ncbi:MAG: SAM-dependent chlorinase/fluorinase, partial [Myxococcota bacterium]
ATAFAFPLGTTHVVVVDPGVGTSRRALAAAAHGMYFVGPDNGVLGGILSQPDARCVAIENQGLLRHPVSATFHGRDVFAPVAAELALGLALSAVGTPVIDALPSTLPSAVYSENTVTGEVLGADRFGNLLTNIASSKVPRHWRVSLAQYVLPFCRTYGDAPEKTPFILDGSEGFLEVAIKEGAAAEFFGSTLGCQIHCTDHEGN